MKNNMDEEIITIFVIVDNVLKAIGHKDDKQVKMSESEIITTGLVAAKYFSGVYEKARNFLHSHGYMKNMLTKGRFNVRVHRVDISTWNYIMKIFVKTSKEKEFIIDSFPVPVCSNVRVSRSKLYCSKKEYWGYNAIKKIHYFGLKVHMLATATGRPIEFHITPASVHDMKALKSFSLNVINKSLIYADAAYNNYKFEDLLKKERGIILAAKRKSNAKRKPVIERKVHMKTRKRIETVFSCLLDSFPRAIRAITQKGFELKLTLFICAFSIFMN